ncbi:hypothetical protein [Paenibacillus motobuensis]|uniref:Uncharacterized protein n=1 Tax=Paenibacillus motobuensis TaxID=295324 RepID=A0ABP3I4U5_9BACL
MIHHFKKDIIVRIISLLLATVGAYFILNSANMGDDKVFEFIKNVGGSVDSEDIKVHLESYIISYRLFGGILFSIGLFRLLQK